MAYSEFPHTNYSDTDFAELIALYKEVHAKYAGTLDSISTLEKRLTEYENNMTTRVKAYADSVITPKLEQISSMLVSTLESSLADITTNIEAYKKVVDTRFDLYKDEIDKEIDSFEYKVITSVSEYFDSNKKEYQSAIKAIKKQVTTFKKEVRNELSSIREQVALEPNSAKWLWDNILNSNGISAHEWYSASNITCEDWNKSQITCAEWYHKAKIIFHWYVNLLMLFSPVSGEYVTVQEAIIELASKLKVNSITAGEYDSMNITADEFNRIFKNAGEYDWQSGLLAYMFDSRTERSD